tara:strand:- start:580 stop:948 length:369 start_codon:yes stop_codon:yes gene_type:complete
MNIKAILLTFTCLFCLGNYTSHAQSKNNDNDSIRSIIEKKRAYNKRKGIGYRIQLYNGAEKRVKTIRAKFRIEFPLIETYLKYNAPEWKIQVGNYKTTLEAAKALMEINLKFSGAIVIPMSK